MTVIDYDETIYTKIYKGCGNEIFKEFRTFNSVNTKGNNQNIVLAFKTDADVDIDCLIGGF